MYVAELDRSWLHTPFTGPGFLITQRSQLQALRRHCNYVYVDPSRSEAGTVGTPPGVVPIRSASKKAKGNGAGLHEVRTSLRSMLERITATVQSARRDGQLNLQMINEAVPDFVRTVTRKTDAVFWFIRTSEDPALLYRRAVGTAAVSVVFGRHLGLDRTELEHLAIGGLLMDIGKITVPVPILAKPDHLSPAERLFVEQHVPRGLAMLQLQSQIPGRVVDMVLGHHERLDGTGYPRQLRGTEIPLFARIAGIVDTFDALTLNRRYAAAMSANSALQFLNSLRDIKFDAALVGELVRALGIFPTGTRVELIDGSTGLVCEQNRDWPLRPRVVVTAEANGTPSRSMRVLDTGAHLHIARALPPDSVNIDGEQLQRAIEDAKAIAC